MLEIEELEKLIDSVVDKITGEITFANRCGEEELNKVLEKYGFSQPIKESYSYIDLSSSKILIVGQMNVKSKDITGVCKSLNIDPERLDYVPYEEATNYNYEKLRFSSKYSDVIFGSVPHKGKNIGNNSSIITMIENNQEEYPKLIRAMDSNELKFTKTSLKESLKNTRVYLEA